MKYTVVIRQAVSDDGRLQLEQLLTERFGLTPEQAQRLASRRTGRLMKPTSRARAELLMTMFQSVGAEVALEGVRDETSVITEPFQAVAPTPAFMATDAFPDDAPLAPARAPGSPAGATPASPDPFAAAAPAWPSAPMPSAVPGAPLPATPRSSPFQTSPAFPSLAAAALLERPGDVELIRDSSPFARSPMPEVTAPRVSSTPAPAAPMTAAPMTAAPSPAAPASPAPESMVSAPSEMDVWTDFTGALTMNEPPPTPEGRPESVVMPMLLSPADEPGTRRARRQSLSRRLLLGTLLPLGLATALTLLLLSALLPRLQGQIVQDQAQTLAAALGTTLSTGSQSVSNLQLDAIVKDRNVAFVRIEKPGGSSYLRSADPRVNAAWNKEVGQWTARHPDRGSMRLGGETLVVTRVAVVENTLGQPTAVPVKAAPGQFTHKVTVGLRNDRFRASLRDTIGLVVLTSLFSLLVASVLANRTARAVVQPIEQLVKAADAISMGDLSRPVSADRNDEIGDLAQALERMRLSLESALERLRRRKRE
ncbi:HAMP domain-containing protein [Deinococcus koreensis]|uniref:histidine kinase n=1 Tax=Deinococcus koreensis TaxID=2054903 RepID=A0A2K3UUZ3_9DEIO|nr:HAMP domain-containing protein [Deinococcus koreensis]PNY80354.1 HAMP domain-containing protein [Deinococcus koreensis]